MKAAFKAPADWQGKVVVCLRRSSKDLPPLVIIHGVDGEVDRFEALLPHLADRDVFAVRAQALVRPAVALTSIDGLAELYSREIDKAVNGRPYVLLGFSFGGYVAFEIARQHRLKQAGIVSVHEHGPSLVILLDTRTMGKRRDQETNPDISAKEAGREGGKGRSRFLSPALEAHWRRICSAEGLHYVSERIVTRSLRYIYQACEALDMRIPRPLQTAYNINWFAAIRYSPQEFDGQIVLVQSHESADLWEEEHRRWGRLARGGVTVAAAPGQHETLFTEPYAAALAHCLDELFQSAAPISFANTK